LRVFLALYSAISELLKILSTFSQKIGIAHTNADGQAYLMPIEFYMIEKSTQPGETNAAVFLDHQGLEPDQTGLDQYGNTDQKEDGLNVDR
jgi:hypothetical protein